MDRYMMKLLVCVIAGLVCLSALLLTLTVDFDGRASQNATLQPASSAETVKLRG